MLIGYPDAYVSSFQYTRSPKAALPDDRTGEEPIL